MASGRLRHRPPSHALQLARRRRLRGATQDDPGHPNFCSELDRYEASGRIVLRIPRRLRTVCRADASPSQFHVLFRRRQSQPQLIVSTDALRRLSSHMPAPTGPILPMSAGVHRTRPTPQPDVVAAVRDSGTVIAFLAGGACREHVTRRVYDVITGQEGCDLGRGASLEAFTADFCDAAPGRRRLVQALASLRPANDPTVQLTRTAISAWVRAVGLAARSHEVMQAAVASGLPDWHTPGDM